MSRHDYEVANRHLINLSRQITDSAKGCLKRTELMYGNTTAAHGERRGAVDKPSTIARKYGIMIS
jgi:hypothetical protein